MKIKGVFKSLIWIYIFIFIATGANFVLRIILARNLTKAEYGLFYAILGFFAFLAIFRSLGTNETLVHFIPKYTAQKSNKKIKSAVSMVFLFQMILGLAIAIALIIFSKALANNYFKDPSVSGLIVLYAVAYVIMGLIELIKSINLGYQKPHVSASFDASRFVFIILVVIILFARQMLTVKALIILWFVSYLLFFLIYYFMLKKSFQTMLKTKFKYFGSVFKDIKSYAIPVMLSAGATFILARTDVFLLTWLKNVNEVALYEVVAPSANLLPFIFGPIILLLFPLVSKYFFEKKYESIGKIMNLIYNFGLFVMLPAVIVVLLYPDIIISVIFSTKYIEVVLGLQILILGKFFYSLNQINFNLLSGMGLIKKRMWILYVAAILNIVLDIIFIPMYGYLGAIAVTAFCYLLMCVLSFVTSTTYLKKFNLSIRLENWYKIFLSLVIFVSLIFLLQKVLILPTYLEIILTLVIAFTVYLVVGICLFKIVDLKYIKALVLKKKSKAY